MVVNQVRNQNVTKNGLLRFYKYRIWDFIEGFNAFSIKSIPRRGNRHVDRLMVVASSYDVPRSLKDEKK